MKKVAGSLKLDQAQFRELEAFAKFGSDLDAATQAVLSKGARNVEILKQGQYSPVPVEKQIAILYVGWNNLFKTVPVEKIKEFEQDFLDYLEVKFKKEVLDVLKEGVITDEVEAILTKTAAEIASKYEQK